MAVSKKKTSAKNKKSKATKSSTTLSKQNKARAALKKAAILMENVENPAHSYGHKKMNLKKDFVLSTNAKTYSQNLSATNNVTRGDIVARQESPQRRIISGASLNKKGRLD